MRERVGLTAFRRLPLGARVFAECVLLLAIVGAVAGWFGKAATARVSTSPTLTAPRSSTTLSSSHTTVSETSSTLQSLPPPVSTPARTSPEQSWRIAAVDSNQRALGLSLELTVVAQGASNQSECVTALARLLPRGASVEVASDLVHDEQAKAAEAAIWVSAKARAVRTNVSRSLPTKCQRPPAAVAPGPTTTWNVQAPPSAGTSAPIVTLRRTISVKVDGATQICAKSGQFVWLPSNVLDGGVVAATSAVRNEDDASLAAQRLDRC